MHPGQAELHVASFAELDTRTLYRLLRLRVDVFVAEQECAYPDLDGRDTEPGTRHLWLSRAGVPTAYLRILDDGEAWRIGRVVVAKDARGHGLATRLVADALALVGHQPCVLEAQSHLVGFYLRFNFVPTGPEYLDDGIPHVPMRREPPPARSAAGHIPGPSGDADANAAGPNPDGPAQPGPDDPTRPGPDDPTGSAPGDRARPPYGRAATSSATARRRPV